MDVMVMGYVTVSVVDVEDIFWLSQCALAVIDEVTLTMRGKSTSAETEMETSAPTIWVVCCVMVRVCVLD